MELTEEQRQEADQLIDLIEDAVYDLSYFSARHDDLFNLEVSQMEEQIKNARKQIYG